MTGLHWDNERDERHDTMHKRYDCMLFLFYTITRDEFCVLANGDEICFVSRAMSSDWGHVMVRIVRSGETFAMVNGCLEVPSLYLRKRDKTQATYWNQ